MDEGAMVGLGDAFKRIFEEIKKIVEWIVDLFMKLAEG